jgi:hypothetical protein
VPTNDKPTLGGRPKIDRARLERDALALGLIEQTARRLRAHADAALASSRPTRSQSEARAAFAYEACSRITREIADRSELTAEQLLELTEQIVRADAGVINATDGWIAAAPINTASAAA